MTDRRAVMQQAIDDLDTATDDIAYWLAARNMEEIAKAIDRCDAPIAALRAALAQPERVPVAWLDPVADQVLTAKQKLTAEKHTGVPGKTLAASYSVPLYASPSIPAEPEQEPVARVAEVHMSRYTLEWLDGPLPEGTLLYASPTIPAGMQLVPVEQLNKWRNQVLGIDWAPGQSSPDHLLVADEIRAMLAAERRKTMNEFETWWASLPEWEEDPRDAARKAWESALETRKHSTVLAYSFHCKECYQLREQGCFLNRCPGIPTYHD